MLICMCDHTFDVVIIPSFIEIRSVVLEPLGVEICPFPLLWQLAFTTACTNVQAVIIPISYSPYRTLLNYYLQSTLNFIIVMVANVIAALLATMLVEVNDSISRNVIE